MVLASKYRRYLEIINSGDGGEVHQQVGQPSDSDGEVDGDGKQKETLTQKAFRELEINRYCCRRHLLTHIDLVDKI